MCRSVTVCVVELPKPLSGSLRAFAKRTNTKLSCEAVLQDTVDWHARLPNVITSDHPPTRDSRVSRLPQARSSSALCGAQSAQTTACTASQ